MATTQDRGITVHAGSALIAQEAEIDWREVRRQFRAIVARNVSDDLVDVAITACRALGFHPLLNHINIIDNQIYINHKGLWHLAHRSGVFDGIEVLEEGETATHYTAKVAIHRRDMKYPFIFQGRYSKQGRNKTYGPEMALARAETMALRRAFDVSVPVLEERDDAIEGTVQVREYTPALEQQAPREKAAPPLPAVGLPERDFLTFLEDFAQKAAAGLSNGALIEVMTAKAPVLDEDQRDDLKARFAAIVAARKAPRPDQPDALTQEIIEAPVPAPAQHPAAGLPQEAFDALLTSVSRMAYDGISDGDIKRYMSEQWRKLSKDQRGLLVQLWDKIAAARKAGQPWPNPDEPTADEAPGDLLEDPALDETGEPTGDPSIFDGGVPAGYAG